MIAAAIADESLLAGLKDNDARLAQLADPRTINLDDAKADALVAQSTPIYYITGTIHSPETGAPTALMELAYRLAVDESPYVKKIRSHVITLITPVVEADGRDRMVDLYNWHRANPGKTPPPLLYWGHYVAHDNNRDAMGLTLNLSRNILDTYLGWHAQVLHDLHESVPFLYDNTVGDGPYNAWVDPILVGEWQQLGWDNVQGMTKFGMPGVFTHGDFDTWSPGLSDVHGGDAQRHQPAVRNIRQFRRGHDGAYARSVGICAHLVSAQSAAAESALVAARQQQLRRDRAAHRAQLFRRQRQAVPAQLLSEEQTFGAETIDGRPRGVRAARRRCASRCASAIAARAAASARRSKQTHRRGHRAGAGAAGKTEGRCGQESRISPPTRSRKPSPGNSRPAATSFAWISRIRASPTRCSIASTGRRTIRRNTRTTTRRGRSAICSARRCSASPTARSWARR